MSAVAIYDPAILTDRAVTPLARALYIYMVSKMDAAGVTHVSNARIMADLDWSRTKTTRARHQLYRTKWARKLGGGFRGTASVVRLAVTFTKDTADRALAALATSARDRRAIRAGFRARRKVLTSGPPTTPPLGGGAGAPLTGGTGTPSLWSGHPYRPDESGASCRICGLAAGNRRHAA